LRHPLEQPWSLPTSPGARSFYLLSCPSCQSISRSHHYSKGLTRFVPPLLKVNPAESTDHRTVTGLILLDLRNLEAMENFLSARLCGVIGGSMWLSPMSLQNYLAYSFARYLAWIRRVEKCALTPACYAGPIWLPAKSVNSKVALKDAAKQVKFVKVMPSWSP
jgi:hypothetical protein